MIQNFMTYSVFSLFPSTQYDFEVLCVFNAWHRFTSHRACALSLSLPGAIKIYMALLASSLCVPVTIGPSISPSPSLSSKVSFPIEAEIRLLPCLCFTTSHGLSCHLLFNSIILFYMHKNPIWIWLVWKKSRIQTRSKLTSSQPASQLHCHFAPVQGQCPQKANQWAWMWPTNPQAQSISQVGHNGKVWDSYWQIFFSLCKRCLPKGRCLNEISHVIPDVIGEWETHREMDSVTQVLLFSYRPSLLTCY